MCKFLASIPWLSLFQTFAAIFTAYIAYKALNTWKHQAKAQKKTEFLDHLTDAVHDYIQCLSMPVEFLKFIYIGFDSHKGISLNNDQNNSHIIAYINSRGIEDSKRLIEHLAKIGEKVSKIESLVARGQVYGFQDYEACQNSIKMLNWQYQRLQVVASIIGTPSLNWQHPKVLKGIDNMLTVQPESIIEHINKHNVEFIEFVQKNYKVVYAGT